MRRLLLVVAARRLGRPPPGAVSQPRLAARGPHRHRRLQPDHRHRRRDRPGLRRPPPTGCSSGIPSSSSGRAPRSARPDAPRSGLHRAGRSAGQLALARAARRLDPLPAGAPALGPGRGARRRRQPIAFDATDPTPGSVPPHPRRLAAAPARRHGSVARTRRPPVRSRRRAWRMCSGAIPTLQANAAQILVDQRLASRASPPPPARSTTWAGTSAPPAWACSSCRTARRFPSGCRSGLPSPVVGAVFELAGRRVGRDQPNAAGPTPALTFVDPELKEFRTLPGSAGRSGMPFTPVRELAGQGSALWAATDLGLARVETGGRACRSARRESRPARQPGLRGGLAPGPHHRRARARGLARVDDSLQVERLAPRFADPVLRGLSRRRLGLGRHPARAAAGAARGRTTGAPRGARLASLQAPVVALALAGRHGRGAHPRPAALARPAHRGVDARPQPVRRCSAGSWRSSPDGPGFWVAGERGVGFARLNTPPVRPLREGDLPGAANDLAVDATTSGSPPTPAWSASASTPSGRDRRPRRLGPGREFDRIRRIAAALGPAGRPAWATTARCSRRPARLLVASTDVSVEGVHFRREWLSLEEIGWRATAAALSDLAADGAEPAGRARRRSRCPRTASDEDVGRAHGRRRRRRGRGRRARSSAATSPRARSGASPSPCWAGPRRR